MIYYDFVSHSIVGDVLIAVSGKGLCAVKFGKPRRGLVKSLAKMFPDEPIEHRPERAARCRRELEDYFAGKRTVFSQPFDLDSVRGAFQRKVLNKLAQVPFGRTVTYGELASRAGAPNAARAVGGAMAANPLPVVIPCHRVVASGGGLGGYSGGLSKKKKLLAHEGLWPKSL